MERHLTIEEVADRLRTSVWTVRRRLAEHPEIRPIKTGRSIVFDQSALAQLEEALRPPILTPPAATSSFSQAIAAADKAFKKRRRARLRAVIRDELNGLNGGVRKQ